MGYRVLKPERNGDRRVPDTFGVTPTGISLNREMIAKIGLRKDDKLLLLVSDEGNLTLAAAKPDDPNGRTLTSTDRRKPFGRTSVVCRCPKVTRYCTRGRYHVVSQDGAFFVTDCQVAEVAEAGE